MNRKSSITILWSLLFNFITIYCTAQTVFDSRSIHYTGVKQDSIHVAWDNGGKPGVFVPEYTYRQTVFAIREGKTCINEKKELTLQNTILKEELQVQKVRTVNTTVEVNVQREQTQKERVLFDVEKKQIRDSYTPIVDGLSADKVKLEATVKKQVRRGFHGFLIGFGVGVLGTLTTAVLIAK